LIFELVVGCGTTLRHKHLGRRMLAVQAPVYHNDMGETDMEILDQLFSLFGGQKEAPAPAPQAPKPTPTPQAARVPGREIDRLLVGEALVGDGPMSTSAYSRLSCRRLWTSMLDWSGGAVLLSIAVTGVLVSSTMSSS
jgi:hypothetical protein